MKANHEFQNIGHADFLMHDEDSIVFCLGIRPKGQMKHNLGREVFLTFGKWVKEWPELNREVPVSFDRRLLANQILKFQDMYKFKQAYNHLKWYSYKNNLDHIVRDTKGIMVIGDEIKEGDSISNTMYLLRQEEYDLTFESCVNVADSNGKYGIIALNGTSNYIYLVINGNQVEVEKRCYDLVSNETCDLGSISKKVKMIINSNDKYYNFELIDNNKTILSTKLRREILSTEVSTSAFTGVMMGMYVEGKESKGVFDSVKITYNERNRNVS